MGRCSHLTSVLREARTWTEKSTGEQPWSSFIIIKLELTLTNDRPRAENDWLRLSALLDITNPSATLMTETTRLDSFPPVIPTSSFLFLFFSPSASLSLSLTLSSLLLPFQELQKKKKMWKSNRKKKKKLENLFCFSFEELERATHTRRKGRSESDNYRWLRKRVQLTERGKRKQGRYT
ncbi:Uncharacterized protein APZ42_019349 [Daphnia magna]|uniref:Uncharacterized protein n=1 Tax=Daphnia magna TaxID=35525 RepID=A0A164YHN5_9CRUS|nr:Uncharacterized protein APZ42_019349 [Daphnia magna]